MACSGAQRFRMRVARTLPSRPSGFRPDRPRGTALGADERLLQVPARRKAAPGSGSGFLYGGAEAGHEADGVDRLESGQLVQDLLGTAEDGRVTAAITPALRPRSAGSCSVAATRGCTGSPS